MEMKKHTEQQLKLSLGIRQQMMLAGWLTVVSLLLAPAASALSPEGPASWIGTGGTVLLQHTGAYSELGLQAFKTDSTAAQWTDVPENAGEWTAAAMDGNRVLFFYEPDSALAVCTLDETGAPAEWLPLDYLAQGFVPVALEDNHILIQRGMYGELVKIEFDDEGLVLSENTLWENSMGWAVRGMNANRLVLEHGSTGKVAIWAINPKAPLFRPYNSFTLTPGWAVRDFSGDFVLIQQGETGAVKLVELGDGYQASRFTELVSDNDGWCAVALAN